MKPRGITDPRSIDAAPNRFDHAAMLRLRIVLFAFLALVALRGFAQDVDGSKFDAAREQIADIRKHLAAGDTDEATLNDFRDKAIAIGTLADAFAADRAPRLDALDARIAELGPAPAKGAPPEAADIAAQRASLDKDRTALDAEIKRAKLLSVDSKQLIDDIAEARRSNFQTRLSQHTASPLTPAFWRNVAGNLVEDGARLAALGSGIAFALRDAFAPDNRLYAFGGIVIGLLLIALGRWWAEHLLMKLTADRVPHGRLRRSALALAVVVVSTLFIGVGTESIVLGLDWHDSLTDAEKLLARALVSAAFFGGFVAGLGRGLLSAARPSWRLPHVADEVAQALRLYPWLLGAAVALSIVVRRVNSIVGASLSATIAALLLTAVLYSGILMLALARIAQVRRRLQARPAEGTKPAEAVKPATERPMWAALVIGALWLGTLMSLVAAALGFVAFAQFVATQMIWTLIVGCSFYLLVHLIEDVFATLFGTRTQWMHDTLGVRTRTVEQITVVLSGAFRLVAFLFALSLVLTRFGNGPGELLARTTQIGFGAFNIGQIQITPGAVFGAVVVCLLGYVVIRGLKRWLHDRYLPTTSLDPAMRSSITTMLGYAGGVVVFAFALSELGFSVERIAWVASALSVGIGFGLQAVVQNFVSGLILLVERPVKAGDWVALGDIEGDIRRINVRATEIQMGDRSTVIVPNSELITKTVRNVTLANAEGRVRIRLPMPLDVDAAGVIKAIRAAFAAHPGLLADPAPSVLADGIENGALIFIGVGFIDNPRQTGSIRSDILLDVLARLRDAKIPMVAPHEISVQQASDGTRTLLRAAPESRSSDPSPRP
ncbi:MAG TPA: DUF3772 domain-containing protein [Rhodanobacteraceae bacterium]|nr:DUF3772 domain-containing protein [Rhodanobacteraceae bacterium]